MAAIGDYYATLQVQHDADDASLRLAYRTLMRRYHPDVNVDDDASDHCQAINEAYACLRDPAKRAAYDARLRGPRRARRPTVTPASHNYHAGWGTQFADISARESATKSKEWRAIGIAIAIVLTIATFAATSAV